MPLAFIRSEDTYHLVAVHGLTQDQNLYVDSAGRWLADYVPLEYRLYPFLLAQTDDGRHILCVDGDSGLISEHTGDLQFFAGDELTEIIRSAMDALTSRMSQRQLTQQLVKQLSDFGLIKSWDLEFKVDNTNKRVEGLNCVNESAIAGLTGEQLVELRNSGALGLMYCQMLSMHQVQYLLKLFKHRMELSATNKPLLTELQLDGANNDSGTLSFDNL